ncbi:MAG: hypothetical protein AAF725_18810, partial [Acidobacteriota bacterium]
ENPVMTLGTLGWGCFAAALVPAVAIGFNWKRASATAANVALVIGLSANLGLEASGLEIPYGISAGALSLLLSVTLFLAIASFENPPSLDPDVEAAMDL